MRATVNREVPSNEGSFENTPTFPLIIKKLIKINIKLIEVLGVARD